MYLPQYHIMLCFYNTECLNKSERQKPPAKVDGLLNGTNVRKGKLRNPHKITLFQHQQENITFRLLFVCEAVAYAYLGQNKARMGGIFFQFSAKVGHKYPHTFAVAALITPNLPDDIVMGKYLTAIGN